MFIEDAELDANKLREAVLNLVENPVKMNYFIQNSTYLAKYDATKRIVEHIKSL